LDGGSTGGGGLIGVGFSFEGTGDRCFSNKCCWKFSAEQDSPQAEQNMTGRALLVSEFDGEIGRGEGDGKGGGRGFGVPPSRRVGDARIARETSVGLC